MPPNHVIVLNLPDMLVDADTAAALMKLVAKAAPIEYSWSGGEGGYKLKTKDSIGEFKPISAVMYAKIMLNSDDEPTT